MVQGNQSNAAYKLYSKKKISDENRERLLGHAAEERHRGGEPTE